MQVAESRTARRSKHGAAATLIAEQLYFEERRKDRPSAEGRDPQRGTPCCLGKGARGRYQPEGLAMDA